jgi:putative nucleotidyltransferase with HDIG domain
MSDHPTGTGRGPSFPGRGLNSMFDRPPASAEPDWAATIDNLMSLAREAIGRFEYDRAIDYLRTLEEVWTARGLPEFSLELRFELHQLRGKALAAKGKIDEAIGEYQAILKFCRDSAQLARKSETFTQIGQLLCKQGDYDRALGYLQRAIGAYRRLHDTIGVCKALRNLGVVYVELGEFEEAESTYDEAIALAEQVDDELLYADLVNNLGTIMNMRGQWRRALDLYRESLELYRRHDEVRKCAYAQNNIAITLNEKGIDDEAFLYFKQAHETATAVNDSSLILIVNINLADLYLKKGFLAEAREHCRKAEAYLNESGLINGQLIETWIIEAKIYRADRDLEAALRRLDDAYDLSEQIGAQFVKAEVLRERGTLHSALGRHMDALEDLEASYHIYNSLKAEGRREQTEQIIGSLEQLYLDVFDSMAREVDRKDQYTKGHSDRVASLALLLAKELGLRTNAVKTIVAAALLHDIGKVHVDDTVLKKPGKLSDEEFRQIQKHPEMGVSMLRGKEFPWDIKPLILHHHEKINGRGYPLGLKGEDIPLGARIISIADVFDALTSDRVYRPSFSTDKALEIMNEDSGTAFDPVLLKCFMSMIHQGKADRVINSRTREGEMYSIWSQCMSDESEDVASSDDRAAAADDHSRKSRVTA